VGYLHIIFSTKNRIDWIRPDIETRIWEYLGGIAKNHKLHPKQIGGIDNHVHALIGTHPTVSPSDAAKYLKGGSSGWIKDEFSGLDRFAWQDGFGAFSVSKTALPEVERYIQNQREHHQEQTFEEELLQLFKLHGIEYDERYVFG
jgi:REP element-mobilizing transposase RayT